MRLKARAVATLVLLDQRGALRPLQLCRALGETPRENEALMADMLRLDLVTFITPDYAITSHGRNVLVLDC